MRGIERGRRAAKNAPIHPEHVSRRDTDTSLVLFTVSAAPLCLFLTEIKLTATHCPNKQQERNMAVPAAACWSSGRIPILFFVQQIRIRRETISKWIAFYLERENQGKSLRLYHLRVFFTLLLSEFLIILGVPYPPCPSFALVVGYPFYDGELCVGRFGSFQ